MRSVSSGLPLYILMHNKVSSWKMVRNSLLVVKCVTFDKSSRFRSIGVLEGMRPVASGLPLNIVSFVVENG